jgi:hypothetical protein
MKFHQQIFNASVAMAIGEALGINFWNRSPTTEEISDYYFSSNKVEFSDATYLYLSSLSSTMGANQSHSDSPNSYWWKTIYDNSLLFFLSWNDEFDYYKIKKESWDDCKKLMSHSRVDYYFERFVVDGRGFNFGKTTGNLGLFRALPFLFFDINLDQKDFKRFIYQTHQNEKSLDNIISLVEALKMGKQFSKTDSSTIQGYSLSECVEISKSAICSSTSLEELFINSIRAKGDNGANAALSFFMWSLNNDTNEHIKHLTQRLSSKSKIFLLNAIFSDK